MKKKMSVLGVLLMVVALTTYSVSGTYAKYTTSDSMETNARVAVWGIGIDMPDVTTVDLFSDSYTNANGDRDVYSYNGDNVVAPGTKGEYTFKLSNQTGAAPETNYEIKIEADGYDDVGLVYYLDGDTSKPLTMNQLKAALNNLHKGDVYAAGYALSTASGSYPDFTHTISWEWEFDIDDATDEADTDKGNDTGLTKDLSNYATKDKAPVYLSVSVTAVQSENAATIG